MTRRREKFSSVFEELSKIRIWIISLLMPSTVYCKFTVKQYQSPLLTVWDADVSVYASSDTVVRWRVELQNQRE